MDFHLEASQAITLSLERKTPLLVLIDDGDGMEWFKSHFIGATMKYLDSMVIKLKIQYKSQDYLNLMQFAPSIESLGGTAVVILFSGLVLAEIQREMTTAKIDTIISEISNKFNPAEKNKPEEEDVGRIKKKVISKPKTVISKLIKEERKVLPKPRPSSCLIQLKLLDGSTIRHKFEPKDKLHTVRSFILESNPEYNNYHFYFFKPIERITLCEGDELKSVEDLDLNMSTLIVKLVDPQDVPNPIETVATNSPFRWMKSTWESLWTSSLQPPIATSNSVSALGSTADSAITANPNDLLFDDDESDSASFHSAMAPPLRPNLSSFSLYGSQGMLSSSQNLRNLNVPSSSQQQQQQQQPLQDSTSQDIGNGNNITLQRSTP